MKLYVFDDRVADGWHPFALSRPCSELLYGTMRIRQRLERFAGRPAAGALSRPWLADFTEDDAPPIITDPAALHDGTARLFISSRAVPDPTVRHEGVDDPTQVPYRWVSRLLMIGLVAIGALMIRKAWKAHGRV